MLKRLSARERFEALVQQFEPLIRQAFLEAVREVRSSIQLRIVVERLEKGDINGAIEAMHLDVTAFRPLDEAIRQAYNGGGVAAVDGMPAIREPDGLKVVIRFDVRNPEAENWLRDHSSDLITRIVEDQRIAIRTELEDGLSRGQNPRATAVSIVGKVNRATGRRDGGIVGLTGEQARYVASARQELISGDVDAMRNYLARGRRDKRFDRTVMRAINEGKPIPADVVDRAVSRYSDGLLKLRGDTIAQHETMAALNEAKVQAFRHAIGTGAVSAEVVEKTWRDSRDNKVRHTHRAMNGQTVGFEAKFVSPSGAMLAYPHDPSAPTPEILGCRCWMDIRINFLAGLT